LAISGLLSTDTILSVTQKTMGGNPSVLAAFANQVNDSLDISWSADPGAGAVVIVAIKR
jgi:hypothetical protein